MFMKRKKASVVGNAQNAVNVPMEASVARRLYRSAYLRLDPEPPLATCIGSGSDDTRRPPVNRTKPVQRVSAIRKQRKRIVWLVEHCICL